MMLSTRQVSLLNEMGIPVWQRRALKSSQTESVDSAISELSHDNSAILQQIEQADWVMVLEKSSAELQQFLSRICRAMSISSQQYCVLSLSDMSTVKEIEPMHNKIGIFFCESEQTPWHQQATRHELLPVQHKGMASLLSCDLQQALNTPALKVQIWRDLLQAKRHLQQ